MLRHGERFQVIEKAKIIKPFVRKKNGSQKKLP